MDLINNKNKNFYLTEKKNLQFFSGSVYLPLMSTNVSIGVEHFTENKKKLTIIFIVVMK